MFSTLMYSGRHKDGILELRAQNAAHNKAQQNAGVMEEQHGAARDGSGATTGRLRSKQ